MELIQLIINSYVIMWIYVDILLYELIVLKFINLH